MHIAVVNVDSIVVIIQSSYNRLLDPPPDLQVGSEYFSVSPRLSCGDLDIGLDSIVCQSVLSKLLGPISS